MRSIPVQTAHAYDMLLDTGLLDQAGMLTAMRIPSCRVMLSTDTTVARRYGDRAMAAYRDAGFDPHLFTFIPGETSKSLHTLERLLNALADAGFSRSDLLIALGGGVPGDVTGFAAAIYMRGARYIQIPTTLLAAVDASVGGKTAVNLRAGKNLAGAFWQPDLVLCDIAILEDLPDDLRADGAAEIIKYGVLGSPELFDWMRAGRLRAHLAAIIETCVTMKRDLVMQDEHDTGPRQLLNLGHTIGHAIEACSDFTISHGQAVAIGMFRMARAAEKMGYAEPGLAESIRVALAANGLPHRCDFSTEALTYAALGDKKRTGGHITLIVPRRIGLCERVPIPVEALSDWIDMGKDEI